MHRKRFILVILLLISAAFFSSCRDADAIRKALEANTIPGSTYVGMETCAVCHEDQVKKFRLESHYGTSLEEGETIKGEACESCHGPGSLHAESSGDKTKIIRYSQERCFACHIDLKAKFQLQYHHPVPEGQMTCMNCHEMHQGKEAAFHSTTDMERSTEKCFKCHKEYKGPFIFEHDPMRDGCQVCHEPHGGVYNKLLVADDNALCLRCHFQPSVDSAQATIGGFEHGTGGDEGVGYYVGSGQDCVDHHRAPHGSNIWRTFNR